MLRVTARGRGIRPVTVGTGERLVFGRAPEAGLPVDDIGAQVWYTPITLPSAAGHVSRVLGEIEVGAEMVRLRWSGTTEGQLTSIFDAPGGARRVTLGGRMTALLDAGENSIVVLRGRRRADGTFEDLSLLVEVAVVDDAPEPSEPDRLPHDRDAAATAPAPGLERMSREWFVALALAEPWLAGEDYPRPPSNREVYERVLAWRGNAWNLERPQRVDDAVRAVARMAFGPAADPFAAGSRRVLNARSAVAQRTAEVRLVTAADLAEVLAMQSRRAGKKPETSPR